MKLIGFDVAAVPLECRILVFFVKNGVLARACFSMKFNPDRIENFSFDNKGIHPKSIEKFYRLAHLTFSGIAAGDPTIRAFRPEVGEE